MKKQLQFWMVVVNLCLCLGLLGMSQQPPQSAAATVHQVRDGIYMVKGGSGANTGFFIGKTSVLAIDAKMTTAASKDEIEEIKKLTTNPIRIMVITHSDGDHVNGLDGFPDGMKIIAHARTKKDMEEAFKEAPLQALQSYLPNQTFTDSAFALSLDGESIRLFYFGPAHTSGDVIVYFPAQKVAFVGDLVFIGRDPLIHRQKGGTSFGLVKNLKGILALDADTFIPGHGEILSKKDIEGLMMSIEEKQEKIKALVHEGKTLDEIKKAFNVEDRPSPSGRRWPSLVEVIYLDITEKK
jgi:glyoxylase-like metal-dependent hydrolase (beta-lactamase superfamily II)